MGDNPKSPNIKPNEPAHKGSMLPPGSAFGGLPSRGPGKMSGARPSVPANASPTNVRHDDARRLLAKLHKIRPMSASAQRVLALTADTNADIGTIADAIAGDPSLATETLRIANSAVYRRSYPVDDLRRAVMSIGLQQVRTMATAMALLGTVSSNHPLFEELHSASVLSATLAGLLTTEFFEVEKSTAFIAGLLSEMGAMACLMIDEEYAAVHRSITGGPLDRERVERAAYGITSWEIGGQLLARNHMTPAIVDSVSQLPDLRERTVSQLARITVFSRSAAPVILAAERDRNFVGTRTQLAELAAISGLEVGPDTLVALCDWATSSAALMLGGASF